MNLVFGSAAGRRRARSLTDKRDAAIRPQNGDKESSRPALAKNEKHAGAIFSRRLSSSLSFHGLAELSCANEKTALAADWPALIPSRFCRMKIEGLKGCYEKTGSLFYFARMCSKIRVHAAGNLPAEYHEMLGQGFDGRTCRYLEVRYEDVKTQVLAGKMDVEVLEWCFANGRRLTDEQVLIYNSFMSKRGWHDDETDEYIPQTIKEYGLPDDGRLMTDFDLIEMDEGRWYPDMWRDAWR